MSLVGKNIYFKKVRQEDAEFIVDLRQSKGKHLSQTKPDVEAQKKWIENYIVREEKNEEFYFVIKSKEGEDLGVVRLYDFQGDSFCWGSWIIKDGAPFSTAIESALLVYEFAFKMGFKKSHFDVRKGNEKVIKFHENFGAKRTGETELDFLFDLTKEQYLVAKEKYKKFL